MNKKMTASAALKHYGLQRKFGKIIAFSSAYTTPIEALPQAVARLCGRARPAVGSDWSMATMKKGDCIDMNGVSK